MKHYFIGRARLIFTDFIIVSAQSDSRELISLWVGWPVKAKIFYNRFKVEFPGKKGFPINI